jgi:hypothetical protein
MRGKCAGSAPTVALMIPQRSSRSSPVFNPPITTPSTFMAAILEHARARFPEELPPCTAANTAVERKEGRVRSSASCCTNHWPERSMLLRVRLEPPVATLDISSDSMTTASGAASAARSIHSPTDMRRVPAEEGRDT